MGSVDDPDRANFYSSPYLAEHYDLLCENEGAFYTDIDVFWAELVAIRQRKAAQGYDPDDLVVVDVGTGTGRALYGLAELARQNNVNFSKAHLLGFDPSPDMVNRAARTRDLSYAGKVEWRVASATDLEKVLMDSDVQGHVDLLLFADGGFLHLEEEDEATGFFKGLKKALWPGTGRACLSITSRDTVKDGKDLNYVESLGTVHEYASQEFPGLLYRNTLIERTELGSVHSISFRFEVMRARDDGSNELIDTCETCLRGRAWADEEMETMIGEFSGLRITHIARPDHLQSHFILGTEEPESEG